ncbi:MAG: hypothetical protein ACOY0T_31660 [Myxococcota bacterium]
MKELPRLVNESLDPFEAALLRSAQRDRGSERAMLHALTVMSALPVALPATAMAKASLLGLTLKSLGVGVVVGSCCIGAALVAEPLLRAPVAAQRGEQRTPPKNPIVKPRTPAPAALAPREVATERTEVPAEMFAPSAGTPIAEAPLTPAQVAAEHAVNAPRNNSRGVKPLLAAAPHVAAKDSELAPAPVTTQSELSRELALIDSAQCELQRGNVDAALAALARREREIVHPALGPEATLVHVEALLAHGERARATALAKQFESKAPSGAHSERLRRLLETAK